MRKAISRSSLAAIVIILVVAAGVAGYYAGTALAPTATVTVTKTETKTLTVTATATTPVATPTKTTPTPTPVAKEVLRIGAKVDIMTTDLHKVAGIPAVAMMNHVYETLFRLDYDEKGNLVLKPWLVEDYRWINDTALELKLRRGVKFHCGREFDASAIKFTYERFLAPETGALARGVLSPLEKVVIVDKYTVILKLKHPFAPLPYVLTYGPTGIICPDHPTTCGTGPYMIKKWEKGVQTVFERFEDYWGPKPKIKTIIWIPIPDDASRVAALEAGDVDYIDSVPPQDIPRLKDKGFNVVEVPGIRTMYVGMNLRKWPFNDTRVRLALNYAVDKEAIIKDIFLGHATIMTSPVPPAIWSHKTMQVYEYNPEKAKELLREAGVPEGYKVVFAASTGRYLLDREVVETVASYLRAIGLNVEIKLYDWGTYISKVLSEGDFDLFFLGLAGGIYGDPDGCLYLPFKTGSGFNDMGYSNPTLDELVTKARSLTDVKQREKLYMQAQEIVWKDAPWIFLYYQNVIIACTPDLKGFKVYPSEAFYMGEAYFEKS